MDLANTILSDPINKWLFSHARKDIFLVGGYIRDLLLKRHINKDKDYVLKDNIREIALITSNNFNGTFIELNKKDQMFRVALRDGQFLDFSYMKNSIVEDLGKRDFRMNAMAWAPVRGLVDPFDGQTDLKNKIIRITNPKNLAEDPLRVLRAYRLAAQLGFTIDIDTRNYLRKYSSNIKETASERITEELFKLLMTDNASYYMSMIEKDKVFNEIFNVSTSRIKLNIVMLAKFDQFISILRSGMFKKVSKSRILPILDFNIGQGLSRVGFMRLSILLSKLNGLKEIKHGTLRYSNSIAKRIMMIHNGLSLCDGRITDRKLYDIFKTVDDCEYEAALLVSVTRHRSVDKCLKRADDFIKFKKNPLLNGFEIQKILNIDPSPLIGSIQSEIQKRRFLGITRTKAEAKRWIASYLT